MVAGNLTVRSSCEADDCAGNLAEAGSAEMPSPPRREAREREMLAAYGQLGDATEVINERAVAVMKRMSDKLTGRDFVQVRPLVSLLPCISLQFLTMMALAAQAGLALS